MCVCVCVFQDEKVKQDVEAQEAELEEQRKQEVLEQQRRRLEEERQKAEAKIQKKLQMRQQEVELREKILKNVKVGNVGVYVGASVWGYVCEWVFICVCGGVCVRACVCVLGGGGGGVASWRQCESLIVFPEVLCSLDHAIRPRWVKQRAVLNFESFPWIM